MTDAKLFRRSLGAMLIQFVQLLAQLGGTLILARIMGAHDYGVYAFALSVVMFVQIPAQAGAGNLALRYTSHYLARAEWGRLRGLWRRLNGWVWSYSAACGLLVWILFSLGGGTSAYRMAVLVSLPLIILLPLTSLLGAGLRALHHSIEGQLTEFAIRPVVLLFLAAGALWLGSGSLSPTSMLLCHGAAAALAVLMGWIWFKRLRPRETFKHAVEFEQVAWLRALLPLTFTGGLTLLSSQTDVLMLGWLAKPEDVGVYRVAVQGASLVSFTLTAVNIVLAPQIARLHALGEHAALQAVVTRSARLVLAGALPVAMVFWVGGGWLLKWLFGAEYAPAYLPLAILCLGQIVNAATGSVGYILNMTGHERDTLVGVGLAASFGIVLDLVLIPRQGSLGAACASALAMMVWNLFLAWRVRQRTGMDSTALGMFSRVLPA